MVKGIGSRRRGFSLLEVVLAMGVFTLAAALFIGLVNGQMHLEGKNRDLIEGMGIVDDFCTFIEISPFDDIKKLGDARATLYVARGEDSGIIYRKFIPRNEWESVESGNRLGYAIEIKPMEALFADENPRDRYYIPLACKLLKVSEGYLGTLQSGIGENFSTFITVKNY